MSQPDHKPPFEYSWNDFEEDFASFLMVAEPSLNKVQEYFLRQYSNPIEAKWRMSRVWAARAFLEINHGKFEEFYIRGTPIGEPAGGMLAPLFIKAIWRHFAKVEDERVNPLVPVGLILAIARESKD